MKTGQVQAQVIGKEDTGLCFTTDSDYLFASKRAAVPIGLHEVHAMVTVAPMALVKREEGWRLVIGTSLQKTDNLLVGPRGGWLGAAIPERLALFPLSLIIDPDTELPQLARVADSPRLSMGGTKPLIDDAGEPTEFYAAYLQLLIKHARSDQRLSVMAERLLDVGCLAPMPRQIEGEGAPVSYGLQMQKIQALEGELGQEFLSNGCLALAYAVYYSSANTRKFRQQARRLNLSETVDESAEGWFAPEQDGGFNFEI